MREQLTNEVERELRRRLSAFCAPEVVLDRRRGEPFPNLIARINAIDPASTNEADQKDLAEWGPVVARVRPFLDAAKAHRLAIAAASSEELEDYDLSANWPE